MDRLAMCRASASAIPGTRTELLARFRGELRALAAEVDAVRQGQGFQEALATMALFWRYSPFNQWLIRMQDPLATLVAGRKRWEKAGRTVETDDGGITIFAPTRAGFPFLFVSVFDVRQTSGRPLPAPDIALRGRSRVARVLQDAAVKLGVEVLELPAGSPLLGCSEGGRVRVRVGLPEAERAATLAHELAHEILHTGEQARKRRRELSESLRETEAEATGYIVQRALGLPSTAPTYIAWRGGDGQTIMRSLGRIQRAARTILEAAEPKRTRGARGAESRRNEDEGPG